MAIKAYIIGNFKGDIMSNIIADKDKPVTSGQVTNEIHLTHQEIDLLSKHIDTLLDRLMPILSSAALLDDEKSPNTLVPMAMDIQQIGLRLNSLSRSLEDLITRIEI